MRICHITPHLPPDQAANALLPFHLGRWAVADGHAVTYVAHPPRAGGGLAQPGPVTWIPSRRGQKRLLRATKLAAAREAWRILRDAAPAIAAADVVHVHSNGLLAEMGAAVARTLRRPVVVTLYGTEIWHYRPRRIDPFTRMVQKASRVTFYSRLLMERAREHGLDHPGFRVIYPPVPDEFGWQDAAGQARIRRELGLSCANLLVNVKRLHPLAGQRTLIEAMPAVVEHHPDTQLVICGTGPLREELESTTAALGLARHVIFAGLVENQLVARYCAAADLFVLPSRLEACPTVAIEALASGTPVVSTDNPGGIELHDLFGDDVEVVARDRPQLLAAALVARLAGKRRTQPATTTVVNREFRPGVVWQRFLRAYQESRGHYSPPPAS